MLALQISRDDDDDDDDDDDGVGGCISLWIGSMDVHVLHNPVIISVLSLTETFQVNECSNKTLHQCEYACEEMTFGYRCTCKPGYKLHTNMKSCVGM